MKLLPLPKSPIQKRTSLLPLATFSSDFIIASASFARPTSICWMPTRGTTPPCKALIILDDSFDFSPASSIKLAPLQPLGIQLLLQFYHRAELLPDLQISHIRSCSEIVNNRSITFLELLQKPPPH